MQWDAFVSENSDLVVLPLGVFGVFADQSEMAQLRDKLLTLKGNIAVSERRAIAHYLRTGAMVFPVMEYPRDVIDNAFGVSGGSAIQTDGMYYWRFDASDYVERYG